MCIIAAKPAGLSIPDETLRRCFNSNPDGAGYVVNLGRRGGLLVKKGFFKFEEFLDSFKSYADKAAVIHFRIKTHGAKNAEMCHPFHVRDDLYVAHNGIINIDTADDPTKSDTWHFVETVLKPELEHDPKALYRPSFQFLLSSTIERSKLAFLDHKDNMVIVNKEYGETHEGIWYSNGGYKEHRGFYSCDPRASNSSYSYSGKGYCGAGYSGSTSNTSSNTQVKTSAITKVDQVPAPLHWVVECLRTDGMYTDDMIVEAIKNGTYEDDIFEIYDDIRRSSRYEFPMQPTGELKLLTDGKAK